MPQLAAAMRCHMLRCCADIDAAAAYIIAALRCAATFTPIAAARDMPLRSMAFHTPLRYAAITRVAAAGFDTMSCHHTPPDFAGYCHV